ncbi:hypothetical protein QH494_03760 [Sphingomonas sp. AR_OL41]|uniref:hypothetical protein n=1 Tax=Sphingomonas sp. AR_OL41 TaxID=3042729 RepID=UPI00248175DC|nr:hypothetical protein [Sphingomonas sp. AR_OL41]MDH7971286.1 hypothetical protein [Sphingomonas sp. AR_OL41]
MLLSHIDDTEPYRFVIDRRTTLCIVFATQAMLEHNGMVEPLWHREAADARSLDALVRWVAVRRNRWLEWGQMAEALGQPAFYQHMRDRMEIEPIAERTGTMVQKRDDPAEILISDMLHGPQGMFTEPLYLHRFRSAAARKAFYDWFYSGENHEDIEALVQVAFAHGTEVLGRILDEIAASANSTSRVPTGRRRGKATQKAA